jgi:hypothetical protein
VGDTQTQDPQAERYELALGLHKYARRWAVGQAPGPTASVIYDACIAVINENLDQPNIDTKSANATHDRYIRNGHEAPEEHFTIPISLDEALVVLHRYARRYTNGRGTYTATLVNDAATALTGLGVDLTDTRKVDGTIWAADGVGGSHDGLTHEQREEALSVLKSRTPNSQGPETTDPDQAR